MRTIYMVTGYSGSGKDTFYKSIIGKNNIIWDCYSNEEYIPNDLKATRFALADELKIKVAKKLGITYDIELEKNKDNKIFENNTKSFRDYIIEYAIKKRLKDINYFCKLLVKKIDAIDINTNIYITDWRYMSELEFFEKNYKNVKTIRIARLGIKKRDIESETNLDKYQTDILVIPEKQDLIETCLNYNLNYFI